MVYLAHFPRMHSQEAYSRRCIGEAVHQVVNIRDIQTGKITQETKNLPKSTESSWGMKATLA